MGTTELAISTDYYADSARLEDIQSLLKKVSEAGFTYIHWCHEWCGDYTYSEYEMKQIREWMDEYHLKSKALHATHGSSKNEYGLSWHARKDYTSEWEYNRKAGVELIKNRVDLAACLGASEIVLHLFIPHVAIAEGRVKKENFYRQVEKSMDELMPYCMEKGVRICIENLFGMPEEDIRGQWDWFMEKYPKEFIGFCLDSGHANIIWHEKMTEIIRKYGERIFAVHLHDNDGIDDLHRVPGEGTIDWEEVMTALAESAYELPLTLEVVGSHEDEDEFLAKAYQKGEWLTRLYQEARR